MEFDGPEVAASIIEQITIEVQIHHKKLGCYRILYQHF